MKPRELAYQVGLQNPVAGVILQAQGRNHLNNWMPRRPPTNLHPLHHTIEAGEAILGAKAVRTESSSVIDKLLVGPEKLRVKQLQGILRDLLRDGYEERVPSI